MLRKSRRKKCGRLLRISAITGKNDVRLPVSEEGGGSRLKKDGLYLYYGRGRQGAFRVCPLRKLNEGCRYKESEKKTFKRNVLVYQLGRRKLVYVC